MIVTNKTYFAKGARGILSTAMLNGKKVIVKEKNPKAAKDTIAHEAAILQRVNPHDIGPKFIALKDGMLIREFIDGEEVLPWAERATVDELRRVLLALLEQCRTLDEMHLSKREMTRPYKHILIRENIPVQIDFERTLETTKPQNVTQCCQWITNSRMSQLLQKKGIVIDRAEMQSRAKAYKEKYAAAAYEEIVVLVGGNS